MSYHKILKAKVCEITGIKNPLRAFADGWILKSVDYCDGDNCACTHPIYWRHSFIHERTGALLIIGSVCMNRFSGEYVKGKLNIPDHIKKAVSEHKKIEREQTYFKCTICKGQRPKKAYPENPKFCKVCVKRCRRCAERRVKDDDEIFRIGLCFECREKGFIPKCCADCDKIFYIPNSETWRRVCSQCWRQSCRLNNENVECPKCHNKFWRKKNEQWRKICLTCYKKR